MVEKNLLKDLCKALLVIKTEGEMESVLKDLCTPQELTALAERWHVCRLLGKKDLSYREISAQTGVSLATITRVARFLKDEPYKGYRLLLQRCNEGSLS